MSTAQSVRRARYWLPLVLLVPLIAVFGLRGGPPAPAQADPPPLKQMSLVPKVEMRLDKLTVPFYPAMYTRPYDKPDWVGHVPCTITAVNFDSADRLLRVGIDFTWPGWAEHLLQERLAGLYQGNGHPETEPKHINLTKLQLKQYELWLVFGGQKYLLEKSSGRNVEKPSTTVLWHVPMQPEFERLSRELAKSPDSARLLFRAYYVHDLLAGANVQVGSVQAAFRELREKVLSGRKADALLVDRDALAEVQERLASQIVITIDGYGLPRDQADALVKDLKGTVQAQFKKLPPIELSKLHEYAKTDLIWRPGVEGRNEVQAIENHDAITKSRQYGEALDAVDKLVEGVSEVANNSSYNDEQFHQEARKRAFDHDGKVGIGLPAIPLMNIAGNFHLSEDYSKLDTSKRQEVRAARAYAMNRDHFKRTVHTKGLSELEGLMRRDATFAKQLNFVRVSGEVLAGLSRVSIDQNTVVGTVEESYDTELDLKPVTLVAPDLGRETVVKRLQELEARQRLLEEQVRQLENRLADVEKIGTSTYGLSGKWRIGSGTSEENCSILEFGTRLYMVNQVGEGSFADYDPATGWLTARPSGDGSPGWPRGYRMKLSKDGQVLRDEVHVTSDGKEGTQWHRPGYNPKSKP
jgi:hypothetical protein